MPRSLASRLTLAYVLIGAALRAVLARSFGPPGIGATTWLALLAAGAAMDLAVALAALALPRAALALGAGNLRRRWSVRFGLVALVAFALLYEAAIEYFFFDEFNSRFNHIALDYVLYPTEVFGNIYQSFDVGRYAVEAVLGALAVALALVGRPRAEAIAGKAFDDKPALPASRPRRVRRALGPLALGAVSFAALWFSPQALVDDRVANEVGLSGPVQLVRALWTATIDFDAFYSTLPLIEARARTARVLGFPPPTDSLLASPNFRLVRTIAPQRATPVRAVVVVLEESLGADFVGCLSGKYGLTPHLDHWAAQGLLLTNLFATGNRTVRGLESTLCSMVPLPGDSIVKRSATDKVDALPTVLARAGYHTSFFYGGRGLFDNLRSFAAAVGYQQFHEQADFPPAAFSTAWGVADEYIFDAALARQLKAKQDGEKLFTTILSVSNHKPFLVPPGPWTRPGEPGRYNAVRYADWALGRWLDAMQAGGLLDDTAILICGDHGARVYGSERIPIRSYRIPALFVVPGQRGQRVTRLCSQIDLPATLLALAGVGCDVPFFGAPVTNLPEKGGRAFVQHNHEVGMLDDERMAILGLRKAAVTYARKPDDGFEPAAHASMEQDAAAVFQTAYHLYLDGRYNVDSEHRP